MQGRALGDTVLEQSIGARETITEREFMFAESNIYTQAAKHFLIGELVRVGSSSTPTDQPPKSHDLHGIGNVTYDLKFPENLEKAACKSSLTPRF